MIDVRMYMVNASIVKMIYGVKVYITELIVNSSIEVMYKDSQISEVTDR